MSLVRIYKMYWEDGDTYVGSTKQALCDRIAGHRSAHANGKCGRSKIGVKIQTNSDFQYVLLEKKMVADIDERRQLEQKWISSEKPNLNSRNEIRLSPQAGWCNECSRHYTQLAEHQTGQKHKDKLRCGTTEPNPEKNHTVMELLP